MSKPVPVSFVALTVFLLTLVMAYSQEDMTHVGNSMYDNPQRTPALFNHEAHNEAAGIEDCNECHHVYEEGKKLEDESSEDRMCSECHDFKADGRTLSLTNAFHTNCKGCHLQQNKGPIMCGECHVRD